MLIKNDIIQKLIKAERILDETPIATGLRYIWNPVAQEMKEIFVPEEVNNER